MKHLPLTISAAATLLVAAGVAVFGPAPCASACSCVGLDTPEMVQSAELVAKGTVIQIDGPQNMESSADDVTYTIELSQVWKGVTTSRVEVHSPASSASCGIGEFAPGTEITLFATHQDLYGATSTQWNANLCGGTATSDSTREAELTDLLGAPAVPDAAPPAVPDADADEPLGMLMPLGLIATAAAAAGIAAWFSGRRK